MLWRFFYDPEFNMEYFHQACNYIRKRAGDLHEEAIVSFENFLTGCSIRGEMPSTQEEYYLLAGDACYEWDT